MFSRTIRAGALLALTLAALPVQAEWPETPFYTCGRDILDATGKPIKFAGVNWPGHGEPMLPEGIQYSSISDIVTKVKSIGLNIIRLTWATEMVDDYFDDSPNQTLNATLLNALGATDGQKVLEQVLSKNPQFTAQTTRLEIFDAVAEECAKQEIYLHLDNHQSKAAWCCPQFDGNAWFNDTAFSVYNWTRGLGYMANRGQNWDALVSMALRNELRPSTSRGYPLQYNWTTWYNNMIPAANDIYNNNSDLLIYFSGMNWDTDLSFIIKGDTVDGVRFTPSDYAFDGQIVYEIHNYATNVPCDGLLSGLYSGAFGAMNLSDSTYANHGPVVLSEFGFGQGDDSYNGVYAQCLKNALLDVADGPGNFMYWVLAGSYMFRTYVGSDADETYGLLNHDWSDWRNQTVIDAYFKPLIETTLASVEL